MEVIKNLFTKVDGILSGFLKPLIDQLVTFLQSGQYTVIAVIVAFIVLLILVGFFRWLRKAPKLFFFIIILFGLIIGAWVFSK